MSWGWFVTSFTKKKDRPSISTHGNESYPPKMKHPKFLWIKNPTKQWFLRALSMSFMFFFKKKKHDNPDNHAVTQPF